MTMIVKTVEKDGCHTAELSSVFYLKKRSIFLTGQITDALSTEVIQQILYLADISQEDITLYINSPGGSVSAGLAIYDVMKSCGCDVVTVCSGIAASMGAFLLASGTHGKRYAAAHSEVMIHQVMGGAQGQAADIEICAARIRSVKDTLNSLLAEMTGQPVERIKIDTDRDYFMTAQQAIEYGIADHIYHGSDFRSG